MSGEADAEVLPGSEPGADARHDPGIEDASVAGIVPWWRRSLAIGAVVIAAATTSWLSGRSPVGLAGLLVVLLALLPALARSRSFGRSAVGVAIVIFLLAIAGVFLALFVYLPVAALLLLAWLADPAVRPRTAPYTAFFAGAFLILLLIVWTVEIHRAF